MVVPASAPPLTDGVDETAAALDVVDGLGGSSAQVEFQRRHDARQERVRAKFPRMGGFLLAAR